MLNIYSEFKGFLEEVKGSISKIEGYSLFLFFLVLVTTIWITFILEISFLSLFRNGITFNIHPFFINLGFIFVLFLLLVFILHFYRKIIYKGKIVIICDSKDYGLQTNINFHLKAINNKIKNNYYLSNEYEDKIIIGKSLFSTKYSDLDYYLYKYDIDSIIYISSIGEDLLKSNNNSDIKFSINYLSNNYTKNKWLFKSLKSIFCLDNNYTDTDLFINIYLLHFYTKYNLLKYNQEKITQKFSDYIIRLFFENNSFRDKYSQNNKSFNNLLSIFCDIGTYNFSNKYFFDKLPSKTEKEKGFLNELFLFNYYKKHLPNNENIDFLLHFYSNFNFNNSILTKEESKKIEKDLKNLLNNQKKILNNSFNSLIYKLSENSLIKIVENKNITKYIKKFNFDLENFNYKKDKDSLYSYLIYLFAKGDKIGLIEIKSELNYLYKNNINIYNTDIEKTIQIIDLINKKI